MQADDRIKGSSVQIEAVWQLFLHLVSVRRPQQTSSGTGRKNSSRDAANMPVDLNGYWKMISNENFEEYLKALGEEICKTGMEGLGKEWLWIYQA